MRLVAALFVSLLLTSHARADDVLGLGSDGLALSGSLAAREGHAASAYYNPAGLVAANDPAGLVELSLGYRFGAPILYLDGLDGAEVQLAAPAQNISLIDVGARFDLGRAIGVKGLHVGAFLSLPGSQIFHWSIRPNDAPTWYFYGDRAQHLAMHFAAAYRPHPRISIGIGAQVLFNTATYTTGEVIDATTVIDPETGETRFDVRASLGEEVRVFGRAAPNVGLLVKARDELSFGLDYRAKIYVDDWGWTRIGGAPGLGALGFVHRFAHYFQPHQLTGAARLDLPRVTLSVDVTWARWSKGLTANHEQLGAGRFGDIVIPSAAASVTIRPGLELLAGMRFAKSPITNAGGPTNNLHNDELSGSVGLALDLERMTSRADLPFRFTGAFRMAGLIANEEVKDFRRFPDDASWMSNPGYPGYRHGGVIPAFALSVEARF
jgi:hypothetical protein